MSEWPCIELNAKRKTHKPVFKIKSFFGPWFYCSASFEASSFQWFFREVSGALTQPEWAVEECSHHPSWEDPWLIFNLFCFFLNVGWLKLSRQEKSSFHPDGEKDVISNWKGLGAGEWEKDLLFISVSSWVSNLHLGAGAECCSGSTGKLTWGLTVRRGSQIPTASSGLRRGRGPCKLPHRPARCSQAALCLSPVAYIERSGCQDPWCSQFTKPTSLLFSSIPGNLQAIWSPIDSASHFFFFSCHAYLPIWQS